MTPTRTPSTPPPPPPDIPGWTLLRAIGRGSYGEVWLARGTDGTLRALKIVERDRFDQDRPYQRELSGIRRFEPVSRRHPSQIAVFHVGENEAGGFFYYLMELADDAGGRHPIDPATYQPRTLQSESARRGRLPHAECIEIGLALATALDHLHQHGLVHRDIKPSNVIFVDGIPKLADIGLVTSFDATRSFVGTEGFLPPEGPGTPRADLYSLGKVLYEIRTGRDRLEFPELPTLTGESRPADELLEFNLVLLKACQNDPDRRYQSASEMLADLRVLRGGQSLRHQRARAARLRTARAAAIALGLIAAIALGAFHWSQQRRLERLRAEKEQEEVAGRRAEAIAASQSRRLADAYVNRADQLARGGDFAGALVFLQRAEAVDPPRPERTQARRQRLGSWLPQLPAPVGGLALPDRIARFHLAPGSPRLLLIDAGGGAHIASPTSAPSLRLSLPRPVRQAALHPDGDRAITVDDQGAITLITQLESRPVALPVLGPGATGPVQLAPHGRQLAAVRDASNVVVFESSARRERCRIAHGQAVTALAFSPEGEFLATATDHRHLRVWQTATGEPVTPFIPLDGPASSLTFSPDGRRLLVITPNRVRLHDARSGEPARVQPQLESPATHACFTPDGRHLIAAGSDGIARVSDSITARWIASLALGEPILGLTTSADARFVAIFGTSTVGIWETATWNRRPAVLAVDGGTDAARFTASADRLLVRGPDGALRAWALDRPAPEALQSELLALSPPADSWAQWLSGRRLADNGELAPLDGPEDRRTMETIRPRAARLSALDSPSPEFPSAAWHATAARQAEASRQWFTSLFHWAQAQQRDPALAEARAGLARVAEAREAAEADAARPAALATRVPARTPGTAPVCLDLGDRYNALLNEPWLPTSTGAPANDLASLPAGAHRFNGIDFDLRGVIQLASRAAEHQGARFPQAVDGISVQRPARRLHFLHGAVWPSLSGTTIGRYLVHYADGGRHEIPLVFGRDVREWWASPTQQPLTTGAAIAWEGSNPASAAAGLRLRLFQMTWTNPRPGIPIARIDFTSAMETSAPFVLAITAEP